MHELSIRKQNEMKTINVNDRLFPYPSRAKTQFERIKGKCNSRLIFVSNCLSNSVCGVWCIWHMVRSSRVQIQHSRYIVFERLTSNRNIRHLVMINYVISVRFVVFCFSTIQNMYNEFMKLFLVASGMSNVILLRNDIYFIVKIAKRKRRVSRELNIEIQ